MLKESADVPTSFYISLNQLIWVVFDFMEVLLEFFDPEVKEIYSLLVKSLHQYPRSLTFAVFGSSWTAAVENFYRQFQMFDPVLILHPWMTTVPLFGDSIIKAVMCSSRDLLTEFLKTLKKEDVKKKIKNRRSVLVCCTDDISADVLWKTFHSKQVCAYRLNFLKF